jgi:ribulose-5-phosphate 4-epimerase/fuculose-1-phosphate aldolase
MDGAGRPEFPSLKGRVSPEEWQARVDLACTYRLVAHYGWTHGISNHISLRAPGDDEHFLINPHGLQFREVTASSLIKVDLDGNIVSETEFGINPAGFVIHSAVHAARKDIACALHTHTEAGMAVAALKCGLLPLNMSAIRFHNRIAYHDYEGVTVRVDERQRLAADLGQHNAMILRNHGLLTLGKTPGDAFMLMYHLEKSCRSQLAVMQTGAELEIPSDEVLEKSATESLRTLNHAEHPAWPALTREMDDFCPGYGD